MTQNQHQKNVSRITYRIWEIYSIVWIIGFGGYFFVYVIFIFGGRVYLCWFNLWFTLYQHNVRTPWASTCLFSYTICHTTGENINITEFNSINYSSINMDTKICSRCKIEKLKIDYYKDSSKSDKLFYCCKSCDKIANKNWRKTHRKNINNYQNVKYKNDEAYRLTQNLRIRLRKALLKQVTNKNSKKEDLLGISIEEFKKYIEFLMTPEMTWESIDLDHIRPLSSFDLTNPDN